MEPNVDLVMNGAGQGSVAEHLIAQGRLDPGMMRPYYDPKTKASYVSVYKGGDPDADESYLTNLHSTNMVTNASTLRRDEWKLLDDAVMQIAEQRLGAVSYIRSKGLTYTLGNGLGRTVFEWHDVSDAVEADMTMDGVTRAPNDRPVFQTNYLPLPIIHADYEINARVLAVSRNMGDPLDTIMAERAARKVMEQVEKMLVTNVTYSWGTKDDRNRNTIYSLVNFPDRNQVTLSVGWDDSAKSARNIVDEVLTLKQTAINAYHYGPYGLIIPSTYETVLDEDYEDTGQTARGLTIRQRILQIGNITDILVSDFLATDNVLLVQLTPDVVRMIDGMPTQNVQWNVEGNTLSKYKVMTIQVPQVRSDQNGRCGVVHLA